MPHKPPSACRYSGCPNLCEAGQSYCPEHQKAQTMAYDKARGTASQRGYGSKWQIYRRAFLKRHPVCKCGRPATQVDHIIPARPNDPLFWEPSNHQSLCDTCHSQKTAREDAGFGNRSNSQRK